MNKEEILEMSRAENKNRDIYEQEVLKQAGAIVFSAYMTTFWVKYIRLRRKHELVMAIAYTVLVSAMSGGHIYNLIASSKIM